MFFLFCLKDPNCQYIPRVSLEVAHDQRFVTPPDLFQPSMVPRRLLAEFVLALGGIYIKPSKHTFQFLITRGPRYFPLHPFPPCLLLLTIAVFTPRSDTSDTQITVKFLYRIEERVVSGEQDMRCVFSEKAKAVRHLDRFCSWHCHATRRVQEPFLMMIQRPGNQN